MKLRSRRVPLLALLLASSCLVLAIDSTEDTQHHLLGHLSANNIASGDSSALPKPTFILRRRKADVGTKDAPVDGLDGKPHSGPFVEGAVDPPVGKAPAPQAGKKADKPVVENGVMNDRNRNPPKKGTTGVEGGVSEKERERKGSPRKTSKTPESPKEPIPAPQEKEQVDGADSVGKKSPVDKATASDGDKPRGAPGIRKPEDLPSKSHDAKIPDPVGRAKEMVHDVTTTTSLRDTTKVQDLHEIIPWDALFGSFSSIAATEIGDKTFIVAALMAMRHPRFQVFTAAFSALFVMTILSAITGHAVGSLISKRWAAVLAAILFLGFGAKSLQEGFAMSADQGVSEEIREVEAELEEKEVGMARHADGKHRHSTVSDFVLESGRAPRRSRSHSRLAVPHRSPSSSRSPSPTPRTMSSMLAGIKNLFSLLLSPAWVETFCMTFIGELGDRSQIATVAMAAGQEYFWVMVGATMGHFVCTGIAVLGGSVLAGRVSMRKVTLVGGGIFIVFGLFTLFEARQFW